MPEVAGARSDVAQAPSTPPAEPSRPLAEPSETAVASSRDDKAASGEAPAGHRLFFGLGIAVQTLLWFLLFLALVVAVAVGGELTEFRYVGF
jgi:hypothetical protein